MTAAEIAEILDLDSSRSGSSESVLARAHGSNRRSRPTYERRHPGELVHVDIKQLGRVRGGAQVQMEGAWVWGPKHGGSPLSRSRPRTTRLPDNPQPQIGADPRSHPENQPQLEGWRADYGAEPPPGVESRAGADATHGRRAEPGLAVAENVICRDFGLVRPRLPPCCPHKIAGAPTDSCLPQGAPGVILLDALRSEKHRFRALSKPFRRSARVVFRLGFRLQEATA
jgi:hypothetical protein